MTEGANTVGCINIIKELQIENLKVFIPDKIPIEV